MSKAVEQLKESIEPYTGLKAMTAQILRKKGQAPIISSIDRVISDLKQARYEHGEIKETIRDHYYGVDGIVDDYIISKGY